MEEKATAAGSITRYIRVYYGAYSSRITFAARTKLLYSVSRRQKFPLKKR